MPKSRVCSIYDAIGSHENVLFFSVRKLKNCSTHKDYYDLRILGKWLALEREKSMRCKGNYNNGNRRKGERQGVRKYRIEEERGRKGGRERKVPELRVTLWEVLINKNIKEILEERIQQGF